MTSRRKKMRALHGPFQTYHAQIESLEERHMLSAAPVLSETSAMAAPADSAQSFAAPIDQVVTAPIEIGPYWSLPWGPTPWSTPAPTISLPGGPDPINGQTTTTIGGISIGDADPYSILTVTISVQHGTLEVSDGLFGYTNFYSGYGFYGGSGLSVSGNGTSTVVLTGSEQSIDEALQGWGEAEPCNCFGATSVLSDNVAVVNSLIVFANGGLSYTADSGFTGADALTVSAQANGSVGYPWYPIEPIYPIEPFYPFGPVFTEPCEPLTLDASNSPQTFNAGSVVASQAQTDNVSLAGVATNDSPFGNSGGIGIGYDPHQYISGWPYEFTGYSLTETGTLSLNVTPPASPPTISAPSSVQGTSATAPIVFSSTGSNAISITDPSVGTQPIQVALGNEDSGGLMLSTTTGLTFTSGGNGEGSMTITGSLADINSALDGMTYTPGADYSNGCDQISIWVNDLGNTSYGVAQTAYAGVSVSVPEMTLPAAQSIGQGSSLIFNAASGNAISVANFSFSNQAGAQELQLSVADGTLTLGNPTGVAILSGGTGTGSMTIVGTEAELNSALAGLTYTPNSGFTGTDTLNVSLNGINGRYYLNFNGTVTIQVTQSSSVQAPVVTPSGTTNTFTIGGSAVAVDSGVTVSSNDTDLTGATVSISAGTVQSGDTLNFVNQNGITGNYAGGVLTLSGSATPAQYQAALQSVTFSTTSTSAATRTLSIVALDNSLTSNLAAESVEVIAPPVVTPSGATGTFTIGGAAAVVDPGVTVSSNDTDLTGAVVTISSGTLQTGDTLNFVNQNGITGGYFGGVLTLSGSATPAQYQTALQSVTFSTTSTGTATRMISIMAIDNTLASPLAAEAVIVSAGSSSSSSKIVSQSQPVQHGSHLFVASNVASGGNTGSHKTPQSVVGGSGLQGLSRLAAIDQAMKDF